LVGLVTEVDGCEDKRIILPAISLAPLLVVLVLIFCTAIAFEPVPPLEIKTPPPRAVVLEPLLVAWALILPVTLIAPAETRATGLAVPFSPVASVVILPPIVKLTELVVTALLTNSTKPPAVEPEVLIDPVDKVAALPVLPVQAIT